MSHTRMPALFGTRQPDERAGRKPLYPDLATAGRCLAEAKSYPGDPAHWYTRGVAVTVMENPRTIHDFGGFRRRCSIPAIRRPDRPL